MKVKLEQEGAASGTELAAMKVKLEQEGATNEIVQGQLNELNETLEAERAERVSESQAAAAHVKELEEALEAEHAKRTQELEREVEAKVPTCRPAALARLVTLDSDFILCIRSKI